jgi:hypothetical protein
MSDLVKAQNLPQFNRYNRWTSLGANGMPDKLIEEGLKQPNQIKISVRICDLAYLALDITAIIGTY